MQYWVTPFLLVVAALSASSAAAHEASPPREGRFDNGPGPVSQWFRVAGEPSDTPIIFLHGGPGQGSQTFQASVGPVIEQFATVVYYDQRGSGRSQRPSDPDLYSLPILVSDIDVLRDHLGAERVILLGHSFGSILALEYAAAHPERVAGLILTGAVPDMPAAMKALCDRLRREDPPAYARAMAAGATGNVSRLPPMTMPAGNSGSRRPCFRTPPQRGRWNNGIMPKGWATPAKWAMRCLARACSNTASTSRVG